MLIVEMAGDDDLSRAARVYRDDDGYFVEFLVDGEPVAQAFPIPDTQDQAEKDAHEWITKR